MIPHIPSSITGLVIAAHAAVVLAVWTVLARAAGRSGMAPAAQRRIRIGVGIFLGVWIVAAFVLAPAPESLVDRDPFYVTPLIPLFGILSIGTALVALGISSSLRRAIDRVPLPTLHALQTWRALGIVFVILMAAGQLPAHFALPAGWGDVFIGVTAPLLALAIARGVRGAAAGAVAWNVLGLLDLIVAVGMGTGILAPLLVPSLGSKVPAAAAMGAFPMILVPALAVPLSVLFHGLALARLRREFRLGSEVLAPQTRLGAKVRHP